MDSGLRDASPLVVTDHLGDHKPKEALAEAGIEVGLFGEPPESGDLDLLAVGISGRETSCSLVFADGLGDLERSASNKISAASMLSMLDR